MYLFHVLLKEATMFNWTKHPDVYCSLKPKPDMTVLELAYIVALKGDALMTGQTWDAMPPNVKRHFLEKETP